MAMIREHQSGGFDVTDRAKDAAIAMRVGRVGIDLDVEKMKAVVQVNQSRLYGAILMAICPTTGPIADTLVEWDKELRTITHGMVRFNEDLHLAEASLTDPPHIPAPLKAVDIEHVDFDLFLRAMKNALAFRVQFVGVYLDPDGNLVLAGKTDDLHVEELRECLGKAGLWVKGHPAVDGARCTFHTTLVHIPLAVWGDMTAVEIKSFKSWVDEHTVLDAPLEIEVSQLHVVCMDRRTGGSIFGDDIILPLGVEDRLPAAELMADDILTRFDGMLCL